MLERKVEKGEILSAKTREKWGSILVHLIGDEEDAVPGFGEFFVDQLGRTDVEKWRDRWAKQVAAGEYSPNTINDWLAVLRVITKAIKKEFYLPTDAGVDVEDLSTRGYRTYTFEQPNSLELQEAGAFLMEMRASHPQHFAMTALGIGTGLRPSSLRALRRSAPEADVLWDRNLLLIRRSHSMGDETMDMTKTARDQYITLPDDLMDILRWHVETQLETQEMRDSQLLFPAITGGFRARSALDKPFAAVCMKLGLRKKITPRAMRRTFNDLARAANIKDVVTKSISGHVTDKMKEHYSTVVGAEQKESLTNLVSLVGFRNALAASASGQQSGQQSQDKKKAG